ncbi:MAG: D-alanyl-D-alanine carboxypeptidase, partial [Lautropia sp.]|nr:D-alanyl-D-alanine carboxypeptidase [Lautropia sp.]
MSGRNRIAAALLLGATGLGFASAGAAREARVPTSDGAQQAIESAGIDPGQYGMMVRPLGNGRLNAGHNSDRPLNPASTMKLVTTHAAMALLGPDYRWVTSVHTTGAVDGETMIGNLIIKGGGDPKLVVEDMTEVVSKLRRAGLREIRGDLIIDDSLYAAGPERLEAFDGDESQPYNVRPYAVLMNFKATRFVIDPKSRRVTMDPPLADVRIENQVKVLNGKCRPNSTGFSIDDAVGPETRPLIRISGTQVRACGEQHFYAAALTHRQFIHGFFKAAWKNAGGLLTGTTRVQPGAAEGAPYFEWHSPRTLTDV